MATRRRSGPATIEAPHYILTMSEANFQQLVVDAAETFGWVVTHIRNMRMNDDGFPDLQMYRGDDYILAELKTETGTVSRKQDEWADKLQAVEAHYYLWRPRDWEAISERLNGGLFDIQQ